MNTNASPVSMSEGATIHATKRRDAEASAESASGHQYLTFALSGELFAMDILHIKEIIEYHGVTSVPMMPPFLRGVINLRGSVLPVVDLSIRFGREVTTIGRRSCIVILEVPHPDGVHDIGVIVDAVNSVIDIADTDIEPAPTFGARVRADFIKGMGKIGDKFVVVLAVAQVLSINEMAQLVNTTPGAS